jgi:hypothetical protein
MLSLTIPENRVPKEIWIPPELRPDKNVRVEWDESELISKLNSLIDRIDHVESLVKQLNVESRLRQLESSYTRSTERGA